MKNIVFVCTGNICRSPMAEGLLKHRIEGQENVSVQSAGLAAGTGLPPSEHAVSVMNELGIDITNQASQPLTEKLIREADLLFVMTYGHLDSMLMHFPEASEKTFLVRQFITDTKLSNFEVSDPIGQSINIYRRCRDEIAEAMDSVLEQIKKI
ncbi:MAG: low molecular weight protein arginine phosphatase [Verrucomicrobiota bacterium]